MGNTENTLSSASSLSNSRKPLSAKTPLHTNESSNFSQSILTDENIHSECLITSNEFIIKPKSFMTVKQPIAKESPLKTSCDFIIKKEMKKGKNTIGKLRLVVKKNNLKKIFLMISIRKNDLSQSFDELLTLKVEINMCENPFLSKTKYLFEKSSQFHLVQDYFERGHLRNFLQKHAMFNENLSRFYLGQIILAFDLLPKNANLQSKFALNFNSKKLFFDNNGQATVNILSMILKKDDVEECFEYMPPEIIEKKKFSIMSIFSWKLGILLYEMAAGDVPYQTKEEVLTKNLKFGLNFSQNMVDLIQKLLIKTPCKRLGHKTLTEIKSHEFFKEFNWEKAGNKENNSPILKEFDGEDDLRIFSLKDILDEENHVVFGSK